MFIATTNWQGEYDWNIEIRVHGFTTAKEAANFGNISADKLWLRDGKLVLITTEDQELILKDEDVTVLKLKGDANIDQGIMYPGDFEVVDIKPADFHNEPGLSEGFAVWRMGSLTKKLANRWKWKVTLSSWNRSVATSQAFVSFSKHYRRLTL